MPNSAIFLYQNRLFSAAELYLSLGYSIIPVFGDQNSAKAKVASIPWKPFQGRRVRQEQLKSWFNQASPQGGLAIITGRISNLIVLDFDDEELAQQFQIQYPHLTETRTVRSAGRGLPHYYFELSPSVHLHSRKIAGLDLLSDGRYVIAPPTEINGEAYTVLQGGRPKRIGPEGVAEIQSFMDKYCTRLNDGNVGGDQENDNCILSINNNTEETSYPVSSDGSLNKHQPSIHDLTGYYQRLLSMGGRNDALFKTAMYARDCGWDRDTFQFGIMDLFINSTKLNESTSESPKQRRREAVRTIESVYGRPPRRVKHLRHECDCLPNSVREQWLQTGQVFLVRVLDGLLSKGVQAGQVLTEKVVREVLAGIVGRYSVLKALKTVFPDGSAIFEVQKHTDVAEKGYKISNKKCFLFTPTASDKKRRGRPVTYYLMPDISRICEKLGVKMKGGDALEEADMSSPAKYRQALHRELLKRRPGIYARGWLAGRLGVSERTSQRYDYRVSVQKRPLYRETRIFWDTLARIPAEISDRGSFLEDDLGKRYPALRRIAQKLLRVGRVLTLKKRDYNHYSVGGAISELALLAQKWLKWDKIAQKRAEMQAFVSERLVASKREFKQILMQKATKRATMQVTIAEAKKIERKTQIVTGTFVAPKRNSHKDVSVWVQELTVRIKNLCSDQSGYMSQANMQGLIDSYGIGLVAEAVGVVEKRKNIRNPAGFVVAYVRGSQQARMIG